MFHNHRIYADPFVDYTTRPWWNRHAWLRTLQLILVLIAIVALPVAAWDLAAGGFYFRPFGIRISSWETYKPFRIGMAALVIAIALRDWRSGPAAATWNVAKRWGSWIAGAAAIASLIVAVHYGIFVAGGSDAHGYVSQAALWARGHLSAPDPLAAVVPALGPITAPLGYLMSSTPGQIVPSYPAGYPLTMALATSIGGPTAAYFVVPLFGALAVWLTFLLGARIADARAGFLAAILLACSPIFLFQSLEPMNDVPATAWWLLAWVLVLAEGGGAAVAGGLAVSAAVLTRPNLVPLAFVLAAATMLKAPRWQRGAQFAAGLVPGCLAVAALNAYWYGSPLASGYGTLDLLYAWSRAQPNLRHYWSWLIELESAIVVMAFAGPLAARAKPAAAAMLAFCVALLACYLPYFTYDSWPFLRFLLPGIPLLLVLASAAIVWLIERLPIAARGAILLLFCTQLPIWYLRTADGLHVFDIQQSEHRYQAVGEYLGAALPANAVVLTVIQSGSVRTYGQRPTLRWDLIEPDRFDQALDTLRGAGYEPYLLLEDWEDDIFRARFATTSVAGNGDWQPAFEYYGPISVRVLRAGDRAAYFSGRRALPRAVPNR